MTKNFKGGYKIVSLNGNDLASGDSFVVNGLYENLVNSYKKPILVTEIVIDGEKQQDSFAVVKQSDGGYKIDVYDYALTVTSEDSVSAVALPEITSIGDGLDLTDGELSVSGGGGDVKLYNHNVNFYCTSSQYTLSVFFNIILNTSEPLTLTTFREKITNLVACVGTIAGSGQYQGLVTQVKMASATVASIKFFTSITAVATQFVSINGQANDFGISDIVIEL